VTYLSNIESLLLDPDISSTDSLGGFARRKSKLGFLGGAPPREIDKDFGGRRRSMRPRNIQLGKEGLGLCAILQILELLISGEG
jgi:hypothetical protein